MRPGNLNPSLAPRLAGQRAPATLALSSNFWLVTLPNLPSGAQLPIPPPFFFPGIPPHPSSGWSLSLSLEGRDDLLGASLPRGAGAGNCLTGFPTLVPQESFHPPLPGSAPTKSLSGCVTRIVTDPLWALGFSLKNKGLGRRRWGVEGEEKEGLRRTRMVVLGSGLPLGASSPSGSTGRGPLGKQPDGL